MAERIQLNSQNAAHVQAYFEYRQIVGDDDGGKLMSPQEYEKYKAKLRKDAPKIRQNLQKQGKSTFEIDKKMAYLEPQASNGLMNFYSMVDKDDRFENVIDNFYEPQPKLTGPTSKKAITSSKPTSTTKSTIPKKTTGGSMGGGITGSKIGGTKAGISQPKSNQSLDQQMGQMSLQDSHSKLNPTALDLYMTPLRLHEKKANKFKAVKKY